MPPGCFTRIPEQRPILDRESFERNVGEGSPLKIKRGQNALWTKGGLHYGLPVR